MQAVPSKLSDINDDYFFQSESSLAHYQHKELFTTQQQGDGHSYPWRILPKINNHIKEWIKAKIAEDQQNGDISSKEKQQNQQSTNTTSNDTLNQTTTINHGTVLGSVYIESHYVFIGSGTVIQHGSVIKGPCIIGQNCQIRKGAYFRGNVIVGDNCVVGNSCELKNSLVMDNSMIAHFNYVGDSVLGKGSHLSAGALTSNLKLDESNVEIKLKLGFTEKQKKENPVLQKVIQTGLKKFGAIIGNRAQIGCNVVLNPGSLIGKDSIIYPNVSFKGFLPNNMIHKLKQQSQQVERRKQK